MTPDPFSITGAAQLDVLYAALAPATLQKAMGHPDECCRTFIAANPFILIAATSPDGTDNSPLRVATMLY